MDDKNQIAIYGCGGTGIALVSKMLKKNLTGMATPIPYFADTSRSDLTDACTPDNTYLVSGVDGGGKDRAKNYEAITRSISDLVVKHPPTELNLIVMSAGGATGSTMGPKIAEELWSQGKRVIFFMIGSSENATTAKNSIKSWASVNGVAKKMDELAVVCYDTNGRSSQSTEADESIILSLISILDLYSGDHIRLDSTDIHNWAGPKTDSHIALLEITPDHTSAKEIPYPLSVATLLDSASASAESLGADYGCDGYRRKSGPGDLYFVIFTHGVDGIIDGLQKEEKGYLAAAEARRKASTNSLDGLSGDSKSDGMVL